MGPRLKISIIRAHDPLGRELLSQAMDVLADALAERAISRACELARSERSTAKSRNRQLKGGLTVKD
jgi:hypothetical protein